MTDPYQDTLSLLVGDRLKKAEDAYAIYTHSAKSRYLVLAMLGTYLVLFTYFTNFASAKILDFNNLPEAFASSGDFQWARLSTYLIAGGGWLLAVIILGYFLLAVIDIWGLQVCVNPKEIRVQNTIVGQSLKRFTGVGSLAMEEIEEIRPKPMFTHLLGSGGQVRFSPVDRLESLISTIMTHAKHAKIID